jgi:hypothetical protein
MRLGRWNIEADWGHLVFATAMAAVTLAYVADVISVSTHLNNTILVVPLAMLLLALYLMLLAKSIRLDRPHKTEADGTKHQTPAPDPTEPAEDQSRLDLFKSMILLAALGVYAFTYEWVGLDVATFLFVAAALVLLDVRRPVFVPLYAAVFTVVVIGGADWLLHYPMHTVFLP